jgi:hypothetical protein
MSTTSSPLPVLFPPSETGRLQVSDHWWLTTSHDPIAIALAHRHYSFTPKPEHYRKGILPPCERFVFVTDAGDALFAWTYQQIRDDEQEGVCCSIFRNEGTVLSSDLIREADAIADQRWPGERRFTFVDPARVHSRNPGYCFLRAGWRRCGRTRRGLHILEKTS